MNYEFLEHTADIKFRAWGKNLAEAYENAALAFSNYVSKEKKIEGKIKKKMSFEGESNEELLYRFLDGLIYLMDAEGFIVARAKVNIGDEKLGAELVGDRIENYKDLNEIKAATYSEMYVKKNSKGWEVQTVLDV